MTQQELYAAVDARRQGLGWAWWQIEAAVGVDSASRRKLRRGVGSSRTYAQVAAWLAAG